jgi:hypothetical protein
MLEDIAKKREVVRRIIEQLNEAAENENHEKFKELMDRGYVASLEQSLAIAGEINFIRESLDKKDIPEYYREYLKKMMDGLQSIYNFSAMELRLLTIAGQRYGLTNAPEG